MCDNEESFSIENPMPPLWMMYPEIPRFSIGWRMGYGEGYSIKFSAWWGSLTLADQQRYKEMFPSPITWIYYYDTNEDFDWGKLDAYYVGSPDVHLVNLWNTDGAAKYSQEKLIEAYRKGCYHEYVYFWKPDSENLEACFSQWQPAAFRYDTNDYINTEQYMMAEKARLFGDTEIEKQIMKSASPKEMKALGRKVGKFDSTLWDAAKYAIVLNGNYAKFAQNQAIRDYLLSTGDKILVEASPLDTIWGIGYAKDNLNAKNPELWRGTNLLGFAIMEVRDEIARVYQNYHKVNWSQFESDIISADKLAQLAKQNKFDEIAKLIEQIPENERNIELVGQYVRALNNTGQFERAVEVSLQYKEQGENDALWHYRLGYAYVHLSRNDKAEEELLCGKELAEGDEQVTGWIEELLEHATGKKEEKADKDTAEVRRRAGFVASVLLNDPVFDCGKFIRDISSVWGVQVNAVDGKNDAFAWDYDGMIMSCALMPAPVPNEEAEQNAATNYMWPDAVAIAKSHTAHLLVVVLPQEQSAIEAGKLFVKVCDACLAQEHAIGVYTSGTVFEPSFYHEVAAVMHEGGLPLPNWIFFGLYRTEKGCGGYTYGLNAFGKSEIEVLDSKETPGELRDFLIDVASYCIESDVKLQDGETIGFSATQKLKITCSAGVKLDGETVKIEF